MGMKSFVNLEKLQETVKNTSDCFDLEERSVDFLHKITSIKRNSTIGLIGDFGIGKSVFLEKKIRPKISEKSGWIWFDAWKFPNRDNLWEGFILECASQLGNEEKILKIIEGKQNSDKEALINSVASIPIPGISVIKNLTHFIETSPATRTFQLQKIFKEEILKKIKSREIFIVVEDIDRSDDFGLFFLETLKNFLDDLSTDEDFTKIVKVIVPLAPQNVKGEFESYLKCLDYQEVFTQEIDNTEQFVEEIWNGENIEEKQYLIKFLNTIVNLVSIRFVKFILRYAEIRYEEAQRKNPIDKIYWQFILERVAHYFIFELNPKSVTDEIRSQEAFFKQAAIDLIYKIPDFPSCGTLNGKDWRYFKDRPDDIDSRHVVYNYEFSEDRLDTRKREISGDPFQVSITFVIPQSYENYGYI